MAVSLLIEIPLVLLTMFVMSVIGPRSLSLAVTCSDSATKPSTRNIAYSGPF